MAFARRALTVLIAVAVAFLPLGAATAGLHAPTANALAASAHQGYAMAHDHSAMKMTATSDRHGAGHCDGKATDANCCCDDKGACAQACLQKCFGQMAVMPPERTARMALVFRVAPRPAERPPGWSSAPQLPPPRA